MRTRKARRMRKRMKMKRTRKTAVRRRRRMGVKRLRLRRDPIEAVEGEADPQEALAPAIPEEGHGKSEYFGKDLDLFFAFIEFLGCFSHDTPKDCLFGEKERKQSASRKKNKKASRSNQNQ